MASRALDDLAPAVRAKAAALRAATAEHGINLLIYCTLRSMAEQARLYAQGRTAPGRIVTYARPGQSLHNPGADGLARAFDCIPQRHGVALWGDDEAIAEVGRLGEALGLEWGGRWRGALRDRVHFQLKNQS